MVGQAATVAMVTPHKKAALAAVAVVAVLVAQRQWVRLVRLV